jgi:hypothetical protein
MYCVVGLAHAPEKWLLVSIGTILHENEKRGVWAAVDFESLVDPKLENPKS